MTDFPTLGSGHAADLADAEGREVIVVQETLTVLLTDGIYHLFF